MARGWIKLWRQVDDSAISHLSPLHFRVWCWILTNACQRPTTLSSSGEELKPGELATTYGRISSAVAWKENRADVVPSLQQIRTVIRNLEKLEMVQNCNRTSTGHPSELPQELQQGYLLLKVLHWDTYQGAEKVTATETVTGLQQGIPENFNNRIRNKEEKKEKKEPKILVVSDDEQAVFDRWKEVIHANGRTKLDAPRLKAIRWAIDNYEMEGAMEALDGLANDSWSLEGEFTRREISMVFRDAVHAERYMNKAVKPLTEIQKALRDAGVV